MAAMTIAGALAGGSRALAGGSKMLAGSANKGASMGGVQSTNAVGSGTAGRVNSAGSAGMDTTSGTASQAANPVDRVGSSVAHPLEEMTEAIRSAHGLGPSAPGPAPENDDAAEAGPNKGPDSLHARGGSSTAATPPMPHHQAPRRRPQHRPSMSYVQQWQQAPAPGAVGR